MQLQKCRKINYMADLIGARIERKEDKKFLTGKGRYTADINLPLSLIHI